MEDPMSCKDISISALFIRVCTLIFASMGAYLRPRFSAWQFSRPTQAQETTTQELETFNYLLS